MDKEAMKLALEALKENHQIGSYVIEALEEALAKQEQGEPVAWIVEFESGDQELHFDEQSVGETQIPLYTTPQQRTWVGLTWNDVPDEWVGKVAFMEGAKWADKQLKGKNT
jgi:hypothetical protein